MTKSLKLTYGTALLSLLIVTLAVFRVSSAAFSDDTANPGNTWEAGAVALTDDDSGDAMFTVTGMLPGQEEIRCITVTYTGTTNVGSVKLYASSNGDLAPYLNVEVEVGTGGGFGDCTGFTPSGTIVNKTLTAFSTDHSSYANGAAGWTPAGSPESRVFRFSVDLDDATPNSAQGESAGATFTWEIQTT